MSLFIVAGDLSLRRLCTIVDRSAMLYETTEEIPTSSTMAPLALANDFVAAIELGNWPLVTAFLEMVPTSSAGSLFRFFGAGAPVSPEEVLAERAWASAAARALVRTGAE